MFNSNLKPHIYKSLLAVVTLITVASCSASGPIDSNNGITIERIDSDSAIISQAYLSQINDNLKLRGELRRRTIGRSAIPGHLHISLIDSQGKTVKEADISYMRKSIRSLTATFNTLLPMELEPGSIVRITHYNTQTHITPDEKKDVWRNIE